MSDVVSGRGLALPSLVLPPGAFRLLLALAVVVSHVSRLDIGRLAVLLFFLLSGYWTTKIFTAKFGPCQIRRYYASRYLRVFPLFLIATLGAAWLLHKPLHFENFSLLGVGSSDNDPTGVSWSLDVELQFYLLLPLILTALALPRLAIAFGVAALAVLGWWLDNRYGVTTLAKYLPAFLIGVLIQRHAWTPSERIANLSLLGFGAMTAITAFTPFITKIGTDPFDQDIWAVAWMAPLVPYVARSLTVRGGRMDRDFGNWSFPLYLVHFPIIAYATAHYGQAMPVKIAAAGVACLLALAIYYAVDRPIDAWRVRLTER